jgi:hypothetical protein
MKTGSIGTTYGRRKADVARLHGQNDWLRVKARTYPKAFNHPIGEKRRSR